MPVHNYVQGNMKWGSTKPGVLFCRCKRWQAEVHGDRMTLWIDGQTTTTVQLIQIRSIRVTTGAMWANCEFDILTGDQVATCAVDGIPNDQAQQMRRAVASLTTTLLAEFVAENARELDVWMIRAVQRLRLTPGVMVSQAQIDRALAEVHAPATPGKIPWSVILHHEQAEAARKLAKLWPAWNDPPDVELNKRVHPHNETAFKAALNRWHDSTVSVIAQARWIPKGTATRMVVRWPPPEWPGKTWIEAVGDPSPTATLSRLFEAANSKHLEHQRKARKQFFDTVEKNPLTDEQIHACVCMDESVMVVAAAGSGKTSTMVAKTGYVLHEGLASPEQILLLAFNRATADELSVRISERLGGVPNVERVRSNTFHAFGIDVIAKATGKKPSLAPWVDPSKPGQDILKVAEIVRTLAAQDSAFRQEWDLFRTIYARDVGKWGQRQEPDAYNAGRRGFLTAKGDIVKSKEERVIADWLFYNGVSYEYERAYEHDTANQQYRQYFPDFYYPDVQLYHEHFALNAKGEAPRHFKDYLGSVVWKRHIHLEKGTAFIETSSHGLMTGEAIKALEKALVERGVKLDFDPNRQCAGLPPVPVQDLAGSFRVFQQHVKNNGLSHRQLVSALKTQSEDGYAVRLSMYLSLYERVAAEWERRLREGNFIDFEDMLVQAGDHVESGRFKSPYTIILADEFQDSSRARIRLLKALTKNPPVQTHLCVVGDDWQGINRFAGSDISVMKDFEKIFEHATRLTLNTTFRCPRDLCDVSSKFIQANPAQIAKTVVTTNPLTKTPLLAYGFALKESIQGHVESQLVDMHRFAIEGKLKPSKGTHSTVMLLGRYRDDAPSVLDQWKRRFGDQLKVDYKTVHGSKGLEADYVFVLNVLQGPRGFPSEIQDDPALQLAMPAPDPFPYAEERRLFYVAMTRSRKQVRFYTTLGQPSQFLVELVKNESLKIVPVDGEPLEPCPKCGNGVLQRRQGSRGDFHSCSRFPGCDYIRNPSRQERQAPGLVKVDYKRVQQSVKAGDQCPICRLGVLLRKDGRNGVFLGCSRYREGCRATANVR